MTTLVERMKRPATIFTLSWLLLMASWALLLTFKVFEIPYASYSKVRLALTVPFTLAALSTLGAYAWSDIFKTGGATLGDWAIAVIVFWVLFPPIWFFVEYHGVMSCALTGAKPDEVKTYADFASRIWAGFLALYLFTITQRIKAQEELIKRSGQGQVNV